jgi:hypothetical protein
MKMEEIPTKREERASGMRIIIFFNPVVVVKEGKIVGK